MPNNEICFPYPTDQLAEVGPGGQRQQATSTIEGITTVFYFRLFIALYVMIFCNPIFGNVLQRTWRYGVAKQHEKADEDRFIISSTLHHELEVLSCYCYTIGQLTTVLP